MFNIIEKRNIFFIISAIVIIAGIAGFIVHGGFNMGIDFTGGSQINVNLATEFNEDAIRDAVNKVEGVTVSNITKAGDIGENGAIVTTKELTNDQKVAVQNAIIEAFPGSTINSADNVSASMGKDLWNNAAMSIVIAVILMLIYITFRFELLTGISAVIALVHDMLVMLSVYTIFDITINT